jgi:glycosyltransferase involved in cell wall biosynthesis
MEAFPAVLEKVPNAKLIVAGANHHTKPGYWESIRASQNMGSRVDFRGYVPEEAIPELFRTTSIVVMPYDSATGSSGPAHQACEYGVPIVCADITDFRDMAADEDMAISFYKVGDAANLADQLVAILRSPEQQRRMAQHNFSAAIQMTMPSVVRNYLRWFELNKRKKEVAIAASSLFPNERRFWRRSVFPRFGEIPAGVNVDSKLFAGCDNNKGGPIPITDSAGRQRSDIITKNELGTSPCQSPQLADEF